MDTIELHALRSVLGIELQSLEGWRDLRCGARTRRVLKVPPGLQHRWAGRQDELVVKLYKSPLDRPPAAGTQAYLDFHRDAFPREPSLMGNPSVQQSLAAGFTRGLGPWAVLSWVEGEELRDCCEEGRLAPEQARAVLEQLLLRIFVPLWAAGLRFKDCHPGNFIVPGSGPAVVMIDTDQLRKGTFEKQASPTAWQQRTRHEQSGLKRLPGLVCKVALGAGVKLSTTKAKRMVQDCGVSTALAGLGRPGGTAPAEAEAAARRLIRAVGSESGLWSEA